MRSLRRGSGAGAPCPDEAGDADFDGLGPFPVTVRSDATTTFFSPAGPGSHGVLRHPVILWGNAGGTSVTWYDPLLHHLASHGFIVAAANTPRPGSGAEMLQGLATLRSWDREPGNHFHRRVDLDNVGTTGHSLGGRGALAAAQSPSIRTTAPVQPWPGGEDGLPDTATAMFVAGQRDHIVPPCTVRDRYAGTTSPAAYVEVAGGDHVSGMGDAAGCRAAVTAWFRWQLMDDGIARDQFVGPGPAPALAASPRYSACRTNAHLRALGAEVNPRRAQGDTVRPAAP